MIGRLTYGFKIYFKTKIVHFDTIFFVSKRRLFEIKINFAFKSFFLETKIIASKNHIAHALHYLFTLEPQCKELIQVLRKFKKIKKSKKTQTEK